VTLDTNLKDTSQGEVQGSQVVANVVHTFVDIAHRCRHGSGRRGRSAKCLQVLCTLVVTLHNKLKHTS